VSLRPPDLVGRWRLDRSLHDRRAGTWGCLHGQLLVRASGPALRWQESGLLRWDSRVSPATRTYLLVPAPGGGWDVLFDDGRFFHAWTPGVRVRHECGRDVYFGLVEGSADRPRVRWRVSGATKDLDLVTRLRRLG